MAKCAGTKDSGILGYFTNGAVMMNYDAEADESVIEYVMDSYWRDHKHSKLGTLIGNLGVWYGKLTLSSVDFYKNWQTSNDKDYINESINNHPEL